VTLTIHPPRIDELPGLSDLCLRSKAVWGYDAEFLAACRGELSFGPNDLEVTPIVVAERDQRLLGVAQVKLMNGEADLAKLFVDPDALRGGIGRALLHWAIDVAAERGAGRLIIESDPGAAQFYRRMGAYDAGEAASGSIPGRTLPRLVIDLGDPRVTSP
jgi:GNAT superfamily N-acetyltransferase